MILKQLIEELQKFDENLKVIVSSYNGDYQFEVYEEEPQVQKIYLNENGDIHRLFLEEDYKNK